MQDSPEYLARKKFFNRLLTIYGRKPCLEALQDKHVQVYRLHLSESNKPAPILDEIVALAKARGAEVLYHDKRQLSHISKNSKQDQGIAMDLVLAGFTEHEDYLADFTPGEHTFIALDSVTNPQNLGMIIRSVCASPTTALILPRKGCAKLDALVIKASAGTLFRAPVIRCDSLIRCLQAFKTKGASVVGLALDAKTSLANESSAGTRIYVLGNETDGISPEVSRLCDQQLKIPMRNGVESLNVAVTASLIAFRSLLSQ